MWQREKRNMTNFPEICLPHTLIWELKSRATKQWYQSERKIFAIKRLNQHRSFDADDVCFSVPSSFGICFVRHQEQSHLIDGRWTNLLFTLLIEFVVANGKRT